MGGGVVYGLNSGWRLMAGGRGWWIFGWWLVTWGVGRWLVSRVLDDGWLLYGHG